MLVPCATPDCDRKLHLTCNRAKWCTVCRVERARLQATERQRARRARLTDEQRAARAARRQSVEYRAKDAERKRRARARAKQHASRGAGVAPTQLRLDELGEP